MCQDQGSVPAMHEFRVTKYDPAHRRDGAHAKDDWICFSQIGESFDGTVLAEAEYMRVEAAYADAAMAFMREAGVGTLTVNGLENHAGFPLPFGEGSALGLDEAWMAIRRMLRGDFWCRLEATGGFVHIGWDFYMYVGVARRCPEAEALARRLGLFVEEFQSPYHPE